MVRTYLAVLGLVSVAGLAACGSEPPNGDTAELAASGSDGSTAGSPSSSSSGTGGVDGALSTTGTSTATGAGGAASSAVGSAATTSAATTSGTVVTSAAATGTQGTTTSGTSATTGSAGSGATADATGTGGSGGQTGPDKPPLEQPGGRIFFGTSLDPVAVMTEARTRAEAQADPLSPSWRATDDQHRSYHFDATNRDEPYRLYVPTEWDGESKLPLVMFLHGAGADENSYLDQNNQLMLKLAEQHGFLLVSPRGVEGAYGNFLRLSAPFGNQAGAEELMAQVTPESERSNELSEIDVINVLEAVLEEYPIDRTAIFLTGQSLGSGGTWYIGGKYSVYFRAIAPMSDPFVQETGYPWGNVRDTSILVTEGTQTPSLEGSRLLADWLVDNGFASEYIEVDADHGGMVPLVLPDVFESFESAR